MFLYRYETRPVIDGVWQTEQLELVCYKFRIVRETKKSYIISCYTEDNVNPFDLFTSNNLTDHKYTFNYKCVRKEGKNLFAFNTKEKALFNFKKRTEKRLEYLKVQIENIKVTRSLLHIILKQVL